MLGKTVDNQRSCLKKIEYVEPVVSYALTEDDESTITIPRAVSKEVEAEIKI